MLKMKETRASLLNDFMMGTVPNYKIEEHMKSKLAGEEDEINSVIKPEYLKNSAVENIRVSLHKANQYSVQATCMIGSVLIKKRRSVWPTIQTVT